MLTLGPLGFATPWLLWGLLALPLLWLLLRAVPPAPIRRRFPGVALLLGLKDETAEADKTPLWLLLLRMAAIAAAILAFAGPVLNPEAKQAGSGPLLLVIDGGWADSRDWPSRIERADHLLQEAGRNGRTVAVIRLADRPDLVQFQTADQWLGRLAALQPAAWAPRQMGAWIAALPQGDFDTIWLSDGLDHPDRRALAEALQAKGALQVIESATPLYALKPADFSQGEIQLSLLRLPNPAPVSREIAGIGPDPAGIERELARIPVSFAPGETEAKVTMDLPPELRNRVSRFEVVGLRAAGAVSLTDDSLKRRKVALIAQGPAAEGLQLLSPLHYLRQALSPVADLLEGSLADTLPTNPDVVILPDVARLTATEDAALQDWLRKGGLLLRFAGPKLAAADHSQIEDDPLLPVRLREGGRNVGGAMSWGEPKGLAPFPEDSPFFGLDVPEDVTIAAQVLAEPGPELAERTIAALDDGTPLVTRSRLDQGQVVLIHVTANAEWSSLPLSGLFVQMLERLAISTRATQMDAADLQGQTWVADRVLNAWGESRDAGEMAGISGETLAKAMSEGPGPDTPPGLYAGQERRVALNVMQKTATLAPAQWPSGVQLDSLGPAAERSLKAPFLLIALAALLLDILASLFVAGRLGGRSRSSAALLIALLFTLAAPPQTQAQTTPSPGNEPADEFAIEATYGVALGYVVTGDPMIDEISAAGLSGLGTRLWSRTAIEPTPPMAINIESDELAFFPFLYWPITADMPTPSDAAYGKLNQFLRTGGMILFDTRDAELGGSQSPEAEALRRIAAGLDIPPLEQIPEDHVLTRTFYLIQDFPGRQSGAPVWVEAAPPEAAAEEGQPFRNLNDGVTPVVIGGNDWAAAWAVDENSVPMLPVGMGAAGDRQREIAYRFGINLIMHVLTGNYKSDQVHVPALLERLGQ